jgi:DNA-binding response OmpR family regulator
MARILVVEDTPLIAKLIRFGLERADHSVLVVEDGTMVLSAAITHRPDLILLDVLLPGADGFAVLKEQKANPTTADIPVFMLTGQSDGRSIMHGLDIGADAYLSKPVDIPDLLKRIAAIAARPRAHARPPGDLAKVTR